MNSGKTIFSQLMDFIPPYEFRRKCGKDPNMDCHLRICSGSHRQKGNETGPKPLHNSTDFERDPFRENAHITSTFKEPLHKLNPCPRQPAESIRLTLGQ